MIITKRTNSGIKIPTDLKINCSVDEVVGDFVYLHSSNEVRKAIANDINLSRVIGRVIKKYSNTLCLVRRYGESSIDNNLIPTKKYFLSNTDYGKMTLQQPTAGQIQCELGWAISDTVFYIDIYNKLFFRR